MRRPKKTPDYTQGFIDRHGKARWYFRKAGFKRVALPGLPWQPEFMAAYEAALVGGADLHVEIGASRSTPGTIAHLVASYLRSPDFLRLKPITQSTYRNVLDRIREEHGDKRVALLEREHVKRMLAKLSDRPAAANQWLKLLRIVMAHALDTGMRRDNPTLGVRKLRTNSTGYRTWEESEIETFRQKHTAGSRAALALDLLLYTGQRRGDVVHMGRQHLRSGHLSVRQSKTGTALEIPVHSDLQAAIDQLPADQLTFLLTGQGRPFTAAGFTNWFRDRVVEAGLPEGLSPHGLRKAACRRLAEAGCTPHEIMAISGHKSLSEVTRYTAAADQKRLAAKAIASVGRIRPGTHTVKPA